MGGWISNLKVNDVVDEEKQKIEKYEKAIEKNPYGFGYQEEADKSVIKWWQHLIYDMRWRILYAIILGLILGLAIPLIFFRNGDKTSGTIYGSCLINKEARLQCLINSLDETFAKNDKDYERACVAAMCCFEYDDTLPFKCFHSFPSAYQYQLQKISHEDNSTGIREDILTAKPNHANIMTEVQVHIIYESNILSIELFDPDDFPEKKLAPVNGKSNFTRNFKREFETGPLTVNYGAEDSFFFFQVKRTSTEESLFDTRLGPIHSHEDFTSFSTVLPTKYVYGLRGGQNVVSKDTVTYGVVNGFENAELPFYMVLEKTGFWHGVLLETEYPFMVQLVNLPAVMFHIEGPFVSANLKFFDGPTKEEVLSQLRSYLLRKTEKEPFMPPYWGFGLHLCRFGNNTLEDVELVDESGIPYDSDCISENFRTPFAIDEERFPDLEKIIDYLQNKSRRVMLVQNVAISAADETSKPDETDLLVLRPNGVPFQGYANNMPVVYLNLFHNDSKAWFSEKLNMLDISFDGMILSDSFPKNDNPVVCSPAKTKLGNFLVNPDSKFSNETWSSVCYDLIHKINSTSSKNHLEIHNVYGHQALVQMASILQPETSDSKTFPERLLLSSSSSWTESFLYGSSTGMQVPFTWDGLRDSLAQILRHFVLSPFSGTPICGSHMPSATTDFDKTLCLRWFQLALILPFARNTYEEGKVKGPLDFDSVYQRYLIDAIKDRYTYIPYYYTLFYEYNQNSVPPVRPISFEFHAEDERDITFGLVDQFMIGSSVMATPILTRALERPAYFPKGMWFDLNGNQVWDDTTVGGSKTVVGHITQTPLFLRAGHILPILQRSIGDLDVVTAESSRNSSYTILVTPNVFTESSYGSLYVDDGTSATWTTDENYDLVQFYYSVEENMTTFYMNSTCKLKLDPLNSAISQKINQVKIFGFPITDQSKIQIYIGTSNEEHCKRDLDPDNSVLKIDELDFHWCNDPDLTIWISFTEETSCLQGNQFT